MKKLNIKETLKKEVFKRTDRKENRKYKDSVFTDLFYSDERAEENELSLFNALFDTDYTMDEVDIKRFRLEDTMYKNFRNDVSFSVNNQVVVIGEHQSTINFNMPLRFLMYIGRIYEMLIPVAKRFQKSRVAIPLPVFYVFYNGVEKLPAESVIKLSDAFVPGCNPSEIPLELIVRVININSDEGHEILEKCRIMREYSQFMEIIRRFGEQNDENTIEKAIRYCIKHHILEEYLKRKGSEVMGFLCAEYDYDMDIKVQREEAYNNGVRAGKDEGRLEGRSEGINALILYCLDEQKSLDEICLILQKRFNMTKEEAKVYIEKAKQSMNC